MSPIMFSNFSCLLAIAALLSLGVLLLSTVDVREQSTTLDGLLAHDHSSPEPQRGVWLPQRVASIRLSTRSSGARCRNVRTVGSIGI